MEGTIKRWNVLIASTVILMCTGAIYAFSVIAGPLSGQTDWSMADIMMAFTVNSAISPIPMILGGFFTDRGWSKYSIAVGGILFAVGFYLSGLVSSPFQLILTYGVISGIGQGLAYSGCLSNTIRLFPDKKGLASGIITAGMGGAAIIAAPLMNFLIQSQDALYAFRMLGIAYLVIIVAASFFIQAAPAGYQPEGWTPPVGSGGPNFVNKNWKEMLQTPQFYLIFFMFLTGAFSGMMIASNASVIGQEMFSLTATTAAFFVSIYSLSNCLGRIIWGFVSDKIGRINALLIIFCAVILAFLVLLFLDGVVGFALGVIILGLCFGGVMGVFPPIVMENYGPKFQGVNYGIIFCGYSAAAFFGPRTAATMAAANNGDFSQAFYVAIAVAVAGVVISTVYRAFDLKRKAQTVS